MSYCSITILIISLNFAFCPIQANMITVDCNNGNDTLCNQTISHPCKTLHTALEAVRDNDTIIHIISSTCSYTTMRNVTFPYNNVTSNVTITGNGSDVTIVECNKTGTGFGFINVNNITISGLTLSGCGQLRNSTTTNISSNSVMLFRAALYFVNVTNVAIDDVVVSNSTGMGVAMYDVTGSVTVTNSIFRNNSVPSHELAQYPGGGGFSIEFTFCSPGVFGLPNARNVSCETSSNKNSVYLLYNNIFEFNKATTVDVSTTTYANTAYGFGNQQFGRGGGLSVFFKGNAVKNNVTIDKCEFIHNIAVWGGGFHSDIVDHSKNNILTITNSNFIRNHCPINDSFDNGLLSVNTGGGGIRVALLFSDTRAEVTSNFVIIKFCQFLHNSAYYGGGISYRITQEDEHAVASNGISFTKCTWYRNKARTGSAVDLEAHPFPLGTAPVVLFNNCSFSNNSNHYSNKSNKPVGIGALYSDNVPVSFAGSCKFSFNKGSALAGSATHFILINDSVTTFESNIGTNGGAVALLGNAYLILCHNTTVWFTNNIAHSKGGAIYFVSTSERDFISTQKCFLFYYDTSAEQNQWNTSVHFQNNTDLWNKSIFATTLLPCVWGNLPGSVTINSSIVNILFNQTFRFANGSNVTAGNVSMTDAISINVNERNPVEIPPGRLYHLNITSHDEMGNEVNPVFFVETMYPNISSVDSTTIYISDNHIRLYGKLDSHIVLQLQTVSGRPWTFTINVKLSKCPPGYYYNNTGDMSTGQCVCTSGDYYGIYLCERTKLLAYLHPFVWAGIINKTGVLTFVTADCPLGYCNISSISSPLPGSLSLAAREELELEQCLNRNGTLCGKCITGYCVATNSPTYQCMSSTSSSLNKNGILWLILLRYVPFTVFLLLIIFFNISLVDGPLNSYILFSQIINYVGPYANGFIHLKELQKYQTIFSKIYYFLYGPWNSNYFEVLMPNFCAYKYDSTIKVLMLEYIPALYPVVLFILFYSLIPYIANCLVLSRFEMLRRCSLQVERLFIVFRRSWSVRNSVIHGLTTFLVLSYGKVTTVTALLLASTTLYGRLDSDESSVRTVVRMDGTMNYLKEDHLPYASVAFILLFSVILLPPLLLLSYPLLPNLINKLNYQDKWFFKKLIIAPLDKCVPFFDAFQSCFKNKYRFFAGLYFLYRAMAVALITLRWQLATRLIYQQAFFLLIVFIHCVCQPYKKRKYNILDGCIFVLLAVINSLSLYNFINNEAYQTTPPVSFWMQLIFIYIPFVYFLVFFLHHTFKWCLPHLSKVKQMASQCLSKYKIISPTPNDDDDDAMPARLLDNSSSSSSSESDPEEEDDFENVQNVEMLLPVAWDDQGSSGNQSPKLFGGYNRQDRFTT